MGMLLGNYRPVSAEAALIEMTRVTLAEMAAIQAIDPEACGYFVAPDGKRFVDVRNYADPALIGRDLKATAAVLETLPEPRPKVPTEQEMMPLLTTLMERVAAAHGNETIAILSNIESAPRARMCPAIEAMYAAALAMPRRDAVRVLRFMYAQS
jgi:hypothetical protein